MRGLRWISPTLIAVGAAAIAVAVAAGGAHVALVLVFPVVYGGSLLFLAGIGVLTAGLFTLPLAAGSYGDASPGLARPGTFSSGGVVVLGPIPIFWGSASGVSRKVRFAVALAGALALAVVVVLLVLAGRG